jgi:ectoine hydroxylase-related dioxygenase (phytanoyl-CoA dioxygenase family)
MNYTDQIERDGFAVLENSVENHTLELLEKELQHVEVDHHASQRAGKAFGLRNLTSTVPLTRELANSAVLRSIVEPVLGPAARIVRTVYFDKHKDANWKVAWHQDLTIAVREKVDAEGFRAWSVKAGITHVQPPVAVLEHMLSLRVHLDDTDESNGALRILPGTHRYGRLDPEQSQNWKQRVKVVTCSVKRGGVVVMRPLLLHSSLPSLNPTHRRVLHLEYASIDLPAGLAWFEESSS